MDEQLQSRFRQVVAEYINAMELIPIHEEIRMVWEGDYQNVCFMKSYIKESDGMTYRLLVKRSDMLHFLSEAQVLFDSKLSYKELRDTVGQVMCSINEWPLSQIHLEEYTNRIAESLFRRYSAKYQAIVPLYNLMLDEEVDKVPLARAILHKGSENSLLSLKIKQNPHADIITVPHDCSFLIVETLGDHETAIHIAQREATWALIVLRFVASWHTSIDGISQTTRNDFEEVRLFKNESGQILYHDPNMPDKPARFGGVFDRRLNFFSKNDFRRAIDLFELSNINYHFRQEQNYVSRLITRALELYDSGVRSDNSWQAMYRYVASINTVALQARSGEQEIRRNLENLIKFGGNFVGRIEGEGNEEYSWEEIVRMKITPFKNFYVLRGRILHGDVIEPLFDDVQQARELAHNAIRLIAKLAREFNWTKKSDIQKWFKSPQYPPSVLERMNNASGDR